MKTDDTLKKFVIAELTRIARECPDYRLQLRALELLRQIMDGTKQ